MLPSKTSPFSIHPTGEPSSSTSGCHSDAIPIQTPGGVFHVKLDLDAQVSQYGGLIPFLQFLESSGLLSAWEEDFPLQRTSPNASSIRAILGTWITSVVGGQSRFAHITAVRGDRVIPEVLGCKRLVSEDTIRRTLGTLVGLHADDAEARAAIHSQTRSWVRKHLLQTVQPLLADDWILDIDVTVKPLYGYQEGSVVGHNPHKQGRPSHAIHSFFIGRLRLILDATTHAGDAHSAATTRPDFWSLLNELPQSHWPALVRGDCGFGTEDMMVTCENAGLTYLFKQRQTKRTRNLIELVDELNGGWIAVGQDWEATESTLQLTTWSRERRAIVLRRFKKKRYPRRSDINAMQAEAHCQQSWLATDQCQKADEQLYEYQVLITSLTSSLHEIAQCYRDRADCENNFDELKNQWGLGGFTATSIDVSQLAARMVIQVNNWWSIYVRILSPNKHREAVTSRPILLHSIAKKTASGGQRFLSITSTHAWKERITKALKAIMTYCSRGPNAEQLSWENAWFTTLREIYRNAELKNST